jgi:hypothetical protein
LRHGQPKNGLATEEGLRESGFVGSDGSFRFVFEVERGGIFRCVQESKAICCGFDEKIHMNHFEFDKIAKQKFTKKRKTKKRKTKKRSKNKLFFTFLKQKVILTNLDQLDPFLQTHLDSTIHHHHDPKFSSAFPL